MQNFFKNNLHPYLYKITYLILLFISKIICCFAIVFKHISSRLSKLSALIKKSIDKSDASNADSLGANNTRNGFFIADRPITSSKDDLLNRKDFSERVANTIYNREDRTSIVFGLYGEWGSGKSSVVAMISECLNNKTKSVEYAKDVANKLEPKDNKIDLDNKSYEDKNLNSAPEHKKFEIIHFNPWLFESQEQLLLSFFSILAETLDKYNLFIKRKTIGSVIKSYGDHIALAASATTGINTSAAKMFFKTVSSLFVKSKTLRQEREDIEAALTKIGLNLVVFIDDIDRLDKEETCAIFKLVNLSANFSGISYVLAFDPSVVSTSIAHKYGDGSHYFGKDYLDKIIQVPLQIPAIDDQKLKKLLSIEISKTLELAGIRMQKDAIDHFCNTFYHIFRFKIKNIRTINLYRNSLLCPLLLLKGEVSIIDLMLIEAVRVFYPDIYNFIYYFKDVFDYAYKKDSDVKNKKGPILKKYFPKLMGMEAVRLERFAFGILFCKNNHEIYQLEENSVLKLEQRICLPQNFKKYFTYSVSEDMISDSAFTGIYTTFLSRSENEQINVLVSQDKKKH